MTISMERGDASFLAFLAVIRRGALFQHAKIIEISCIFLVPEHCVLLQYSFVGLLSQSIKSAAPSYLLGSWFFYDTYPALQPILLPMLLYQFCRKHLQWRSV